MSAGLYTPDRLPEGLLALQAAELHTALPGSTRGVTPSMLARDERVVRQDRLDCLMTSAAVGQAG